MKKFDYLLSSKSIGFLVWFRNKYKVCTGDSYVKIAKKYGQGNRATCRKLILELESGGYIKIWNKGSCTQRFYLDLEKYNELVKPHIFRKHDPRTEAATEPQH